MTQACQRSRLGRALDGFNRHQQAITAGHLAFIGLVSLFPFLIVLVSIGGVIGSSDAAVEALAAALAQLPPDIAQALGPVAEQIMQEPRGGVLTLGVLMAVWAASSAFEALRYGFNSAYQVVQGRQLVWRRLHSLALTVVFALAIIVATLGIVVVPILIEAAAFLLDRPELTRLGGQQLGHGLGALALVLATTAIYKVLPRPRVRVRDAIPGALLAVVGWFGTAKAFGVYLTEVAQLSVTYGSLGGVVAALIFFYLTACIVLFGCEFNAAGGTSSKEHA